MKRTLYIALFAAAAALTACADLGFGVDVDSEVGNPYWYGNGYLGNTYWDTPVWNYGPIYRPTPPRPPLIGNGPGSIGMPSQPRPPQQAPMPPQQAPGPVINVPSQVGGIERPGNGGLPTARPTKLPQASTGGSNNARR
ncbi:MAG: hypothetical protein NC418_10020 [Muribaculaceae bacterium]|nr:hypothetical protein [Muribaculaceae bacterium]